MNTLIRKIIGESDLEPVPGESVNGLALQDTLTKIRDRVIAQLTAGYTDPETGEHHLPLTPEQAEQKWSELAPQFNQLLRKAF